MIVFHSEAAHTVSISRKEGKYCTVQQAAKVSGLLAHVLGLTQSQTVLVRRFLCGNDGVSAFEHAWTGTPAELRAVIGFALWYSLSPDNGSHTLKKAYVVSNANSRPTGDQSVVFTTKRIAFLSPITKDLASLGRAAHICTELYRLEMADMYPKGYLS